MRVPAAWRHFKAGDSVLERAVRMGLGIQRPWLTRGEGCVHMALPTARGIHSPAVLSLPALPVPSWSALPDSKMLPQWFLTSFSVFCAKLPGSESPPKLPNSCCLKAGQKSCCHELCYFNSWCHIPAPELASPGR